MDRGDSIAVQGLSLGTWMDWMCSFRGNIAQCNLLRTNELASERRSVPRILTNDTRYSSPQLANPRWESDCNFCGESDSDPF